MTEDPIPGLLASALEQAVAVAREGRARRRRCRLHPG